MDTLENYLSRGSETIIAVSLFTIGVVFIPLGLTLLPVIGLFVGSAFFAAAAFFFRKRPFRRRVDVMIDLGAIGDRRSAGIVPVAILSTSTQAGDMYDFDASTVDPTSVRLGPNRVKPIDILDDPSLAATHLMDVDGDGDRDLVLHFLVGASDIPKEQGSTCITGRTYKDEIITGCLTTSGQGH